MKQVWRLMLFEYKKMGKRPSFWVSLGAALLLVALEGVVTLGGGVWVEGNQVSSHMEMIQMEKEKGKELKGKVLDEKTLQDTIERIRQARERKELFQADTKEKFAAYQEEHLSDDMIENWALFYFPSYMEKEDISYEQRISDLENSYRQKGLTEEEIAAHKDWILENETPVAYAYNEAYSRFYTLQFFTLLFFGVAVSVCVAPIFADEYVTRTETLLLTSRYGKKSAGAAKVLAGSLFTLAAGLLFFGVSLIEQILIYGKGDLGAAMQTMESLAVTSLPLTTGEAMGILTLCGLLASWLTALIVMACSAKVRSSFMPVIVGILLCVVGMFTGMVPQEWRIVQILLRAVPVVYGSQAFPDQLLTLGGRWFPAYQYASLFYLLAGAGLCLLCVRSFIKVKKM